MNCVKTPQTEPIPGYRLIEPIGKGGFGEVWKCLAPGGLFKAIKFVHGSHPLVDPEGVGARQELHALQLVKSIRHPFLLSIERIEVREDEVLIVMELADRSLHDLLAEYKKAGCPGIPRNELLGFMREAAEAIDVLNQEYGLQHLDIKPRNLFLIGRHVKVADFGLVSSLIETQTPANWRRQSESVTPLYAAPENFVSRFTLYSDQYSLAVSYQELLTGSLPFSGRNFRQLALRHVQDPPNLESLPEDERPILARALAKEPSERFASCSAFVKALLDLGEVAPPRPPRSNGTHADIALDGLDVTPKGSRRVRVVSPSAASLSAGAARAVQEKDTFLAGYRLLECVSRHAAAEVWKAQTTDGRKRLVRIINGYDQHEERPAGDPLVRLRELRHPSLFTFEVQLGSANRLALITDAPDGTLGDRLRESQQIGLSGIPRPELLAYMRQAAEALDNLFERHRLQHLCLTPRHLVRREGLLYLLDFGLLELLWLPAGHDPATLNTRYAAPELFDQQFSPSCDQYSLALIYQELLTGMHAFRNYNKRQMALARQRGNPDLGMLPSTDRPIVSQALCIDPDQRFASCTQFVDALTDVSSRPGMRSSAHGTSIQIPTVSVPVNKSAPARPVGADTSELCWDRSALEMKQIIAEQIALAAGDWEIRTNRSLRYRFRRLGAAQCGSSALPVLEHCSHGRLVPDTVRLKLANFEEEWQPEAISAPKGIVGPANGKLLIANWFYRIGLSGSLWQRCLGRTPALLLQLELSMPKITTEGSTDILVRIRPTDCTPERGRQALEDLAPRLVQSLRDCLQLPLERRGEERLTWNVGVQVRPIFSENELGEAFAAQTRDISGGGLGLELPCRPPCDFLLVQIIPAHRAPLSIPLQITHQHRLGQGRHHVGGRFAWELVQSSG